jgi:hypothetical protein
MHGPAVVNGTYANGVVVPETDTLEVEAIPLNAIKHQIPSWRGEWNG